MTVTSRLPAILVASACLVSASCSDSGAPGAPPVTPESLGIDAATADRCDVLAPERCLLPFPNDFFTVADATSPTGRRVALDRESMPANSAGIHIEPTQWNRNDGWSPGTPVIALFPGVDASRSGVVPLNDLDRYLDAEAPVVEIDAETGERHPIWVEEDALAPADAVRALVVRQAVNLVPGRRYVVAFRRLIDRAGAAFEASPGFRIYRDRIRTTDERLEARRDHMEEVFAALGAAGIGRADLLLAFDLTVASDESLTGRLLHMRDDAFAWLGDGVPRFTVDSVREPLNGQIWRRIDGTFETPSYLEGDGGPGSAMAYGADGRPARQERSIVQPFRCVIPPGVSNGGAGPVRRARTALYGHGLLGDLGELGSSLVEGMALRHDVAYCGTNWIGMAEDDVGNAVNILTDISSFHTLADRLQQGILDNLFLARLMVHPRGFAAHPAFQLDGAPLLSDEIYYDGNSQGAILGGAFLAVARDITRGVLGEAAMNYSVLLQRSVDWDTYKLVLDPAYPDELDQLLIAPIVQMLWDRGETNGYAHRLGVNEPLPGTPRHDVLLLGAVGDHQVSEYALQVEARTMGASGHFPVVAPERFQGNDKGWGIPPIIFPFTGTSWWLFDTGSPLSPLENRPPRTGHDPHDDTPNLPIVRDLKSDFMRPSGAVVDVCGGGPCIGEPRPD